jgi:hypothetical protein
MMVKCPSCAHECAGGKFCSWCATPLDATSAETEVIAATAHAPASLGSSPAVDEGQFLPGTVLAGRYASRAYWAAAEWARFIAPPISPSDKPWL